MTLQISRRRLLALGAALPLVGGLSQLLTGVVPAAVAATPPTGASSFVVVPASRLADTRPDSLVAGFTRLDTNTIRVQVAGRGGAPANATAAVLNVTIANTVLTFATVYPAGSARPQASNVNVDGSGLVVANLVTVQLSPGGAVDIFTQNPADVIVDVSGAYVPAAGAVAAGRFVGLATPQRVLDTRNGGNKVGAGTTRRVSIAPVVPATATAVIVNLTVAEPDGPGFWTAFAAGGSMPGSSNVNVGFAGQVTANQAIVPVAVVGGDHGIDVFSQSGGHLVVDVAGYFTGASDSSSTDGLFVPSAPTRVLDTRIGTLYGRLHPGWIAEFDYAGRAQSQAVVVNLTTTETRGAGFFTGYAARTARPLASNLNATARNQTLANHAILPASAAGVAVFAQTGGHLVVDVAGYFTGLPANATLAPPVNVIPPGSPLNWNIVVPAAGIDATVVEGVGADVIDGGNVGHAIGTGLLGEDDKHIVLFGNRTSNGSVFRNIHRIGPGDIVRVTGGDGRVVEYVFNRRDLTSPDSDAAYTASRSAPSPSLSLAASSRADFTPGSVDYYIVVSFTLA